MSLHTNYRSHYNSVRSTKDPMKKGEPAIKYTSSKGFEHLMDGYNPETSIEKDKQEASE